jgi:hypothetical protein
MDITYTIEVIVSAFELAGVAVLVIGLIVLVRTFLSWSLEVEINGEWPWQRSRLRKGDVGKCQLASAFPKTIPFLYPKGNSFLVRLRV